MSDDRDWREAKIAQWAKDSIQSEIDQWRLTAALSWPTEAKPAPLPFRWVEYDRLIGEPEPGEYWYSYLHEFGRFELAIAKDVGVAGWKRFAFKRNGAEWTSNVIRGPLFASEHEARTYRLWLMCEDFARKLMKARGLPSRSE